MRVELIDSMGDDLRVVNAARVSMAKQSDWVYSIEEVYDVDNCAISLRTPISLKVKDAKLIQYLARHGHWTPFAHVMVTLKIKMPIFVARQWYRHTVGFTRNEVSRRYVSDEPEFYQPYGLRVAAENVKQGSGDEVHKDSEWLLAEARQANQRSLQVYRSMVDLGVAPEQARMFLPQTMMTEFYETASVAAYARLCRQRLDSHAQKETQEYAKEVADICRAVAPVSWAALMEEKS